MIISDLNYLEVVAEAPSVVGGLSKKPQVDVDVEVKPKLKQDLKIRGANVAFVNQVAIPTAVAVTLDGKAVATAES